ncbi:MAG: CDGSH iron-sulfur domain-containing protein [Hyphomicrobium sp.]
MSTKTYEGDKIDITFDGKKCIHSRACVLTLPQVFRANTRGEWIHPNAADADDIAALAHICPSGAIIYKRRNRKPDEAAPEVNTIHVRENGPYAVHADITIKGESAGLRATLCRCGESQNKPYCDGAHVKAAFVATGELTAKSSEPLAERGGTLVVTPMKDGPLKVEGNLEICCGSGHTIVRTKQAFLCRCGYSKNKPFCDGTHQAARFKASD